MTAPHTKPVSGVRKAELKRLDAIGFDELEGVIGEMVHVAFRKGCVGGSTVWRAIRNMPEGEYSNAVQFMLDGLRYSFDRDKKR